MGVKQWEKAGRNGTLNINYTHTQRFINLIVILVVLKTLSTFNLVGSNLLISNYLTKNCNLQNG